MKEIIKKCGTVLTLCSIIGLVVSSVNAVAASKTRRVNETLKLVEIGDGGAPLRTYVNVSTTAREYFNLTSDKIEYYKRTLYVTFDSTISNTSWSTMVNPIYHVDSTGSTTKTFTSWKKEDYIAPAVDSVYSKSNSTSVKYNRTSNKKARWGIGIYGSDTFNKIDTIPASELTIDLNYRYSTGK